MKKLLLASTSLAALAYAGSAMATEAATPVCADAGDGYGVVCRFLSGGEIAGTYDRTTYDVSGNPKDIFSVQTSSLNLTDDAEFADQLTLHDAVNITGDSDSTLVVNGYLTQTATGSNLSGVNVVISKGGERVNGEGELVLGNSLTVGNLGMAEGTGIFLLGSGDKTLTIADTTATSEHNYLAFAGDNYIKSNVTDSTLTIAVGNGEDVGHGRILNVGKLALNSPVTFNADFANIGEIVVNNDATFTGLFNNLGTLTLASSAVGDINNRGIIDLQGNELDGDVTASAGSTVKSLITDTTPLAEVYGYMTGDLALANGAETANIEVSVAKGVVIPDEGLELDFANSIADGIVLKDGMYNVAFGDTEGTLVVTNKTTEEKTETLKAVGGNGNNVSAFDAWDKADLTSAPDAIQALQQAIAEASGDAAQLVGILKEITPESPTVVAGAAVSGVTNTMGVIGANAFAGAAPTGKSSGDPKLKNAVWAQGLYNKAEFNKTGYDWDAETWGFAAGADHTFDGGFKLGAGYSYTDADIKTDSSKTPAKTHTIFAYGEYKPGKTWYVNGILSYSFGEYKPKSGTVTGEYDVNTFGAQLMGGYSFDWITPEAGLRYFHVNQDSYTDSIGQKIGKSTSNIWTAVIGAKASKEFKVDSMKLIPEARLAATYDLKQGEDVTTVGVFGTNYEVKGKNLSRFGFEVGAGLTADWGAFELTAKYEGKFRNDYTDNTGILEAKYNF